jgi:hypothetical protein
MEAKFQAFQTCEYNPDVADFLQRESIRNSVKQSLGSLYSQSGHIYQTKETLVIRCQTPIIHQITSRFSD